MKTFKSQTIDDIKKGYEYKIDPLDSINTALIIYCMLFGHFCIKLDRFDENIMEIKTNIQNKRDKTDGNTLESYDKTIKEISDNCQKIRKTVKLDYREISLMLTEITDDYKKNKDKPGSSNIYEKISADIIDKEVNKFIQYEKILISYNDHIINIKNNLTN